MKLPAPIKASAESFNQFRDAVLKRSGQVQESKRPLVQAERELQNLPQENKRFVTTYKSYSEFCLYGTGGLAIQEQEN